MKKLLVMVCAALFLAAFVSAEYAAAADRWAMNNDGTVTDTQTGLMWADHDYGYDINWITAKTYCEGYSGGGKSGWRMPTTDELAQLCSSGGYGNPIKRTGYYVWASETKGSEAAGYVMNVCRPGWQLQSNTSRGRALPVRSVK